MEIRHHSVTELEARGGVTPFGLTEAQFKHFYNSDSYPPAPCTRVPFYMFLARYALDVLGSAVLFGSTVTFFFFFGISLVRSCSDGWFYFKVCLFGTVLYVIFFLLCEILRYLYERFLKPAAVAECPVTGGPEVAECVPDRDAILQGLQPDQCLVDNDELEKLWLATKATYAKYDMRVRPKPPVYQSPEDRIDSALGGLCPRMPGGIGACCSRRETHRPPTPGRTSSVSWCERGKECEYHKILTAYEEDSCAPSPSNADSCQGQATVVQSAEDPRCFEPAPAASHGKSCACKCSGVQVMAEPQYKKKRASVTFEDKRAECLAELAKEEAARAFQYSRGAPCSRLRTQEKPTGFQFMKVHEE